MLAIIIGLALLIYPISGEINRSNNLEGSIYKNIGIKQSLTQEGLDQCVRLVAPIIVNAFNTIKVPDITIGVSSYVFELYDILASDFNLTGIFATLVDKVGISGGCEHASLNVSMSFSFYQNGWPYSTGKGSIGVNVSSLDLSGVVSFHLDENYKETLVVETVSVVLKDMDISISLEGSSGSLINTIIQILNPVITDLVESSFETIVAQAVESVIHAGMESPSFYELESGVAIDIREYHEPTVTAKALTSNMVGAYNPTTYLPDFYEGFEPPLMPTSNGVSGIQLFISFDTVKTMLESFFQAGHFNNITTTVDTSSTFANINTITISGHLAGFKNFYPAFTGFYVELEGTFSFSLFDQNNLLADSAVTTVTYGVAFQPYMPRSTVTGTQVVGMKFFFNSLSHSEFDIDNEEEKAFYLTLLWAECLQPFLNKWGANNGYPVIVFNTMYLSDPQVEFGDGYFYIGGDLTP